MSEEEEEVKDAVEEGELSDDSEYDSANNVAEGEELLAQVSEDLRRKYGYEAASGGGALDEETARAAWAKYEPAAAKDEL